MCLIGDVELCLNRLVTLDLLRVDDLFVQPHLPFLRHLTFAFTGKFLRQQLVPAILKVKIDERTGFLEVIVVTPQLHQLFLLRFFRIGTHFLCQLLKDCLVVLTHDCLFFCPAMHKNIAVGALVESHKTDSFQLISPNRLSLSIDGSFWEVFFHLFLISNSFCVPWLYLITENFPFQPVQDTPKF